MVRPDLKMNASLILAVIAIIIALVMPVVYMGGISTGLEAQQKALDEAKASLEAIEDNLKLLYGVSGTEYPETAAAKERAEFLATARAEGKVNILSGVLPEGFYAKLIEKLKTHYPWMDITYTKLGSGPLFDRLTAETKAGQLTFDIIIMVKPSVQFPDLYEEHYAPYESPNYANYPKGWYDDEEYKYVIFGTFVHGLVYNTDLVPEEKIPSSWRDLADPYWKDRLVLTDPRVGGATWMWWYWAYKNYGLEFFEGVAANNPIYTMSAGRNTAKVASGEMLLGYGLDFLVWPEVKAGAPVMFVYVEDEAPFIYYHAALHKDAPRPNAAKLVLDFMATEEMGDIAVSEGGLLSAISEQLPNPAAKSLDEITPVDAATIEEAVENFEEVMPIVAEVLGLSV